MRSVPGLLLLILVGFLSVGRAGSTAEPAITAKAAFEKLKALAGEWPGHLEKPDGAPSKLIFRVTSGGSAVFESQFPGMDHEMTSVYHLDGDELLLTHYCAAGNQPRMKLDRAKSSARELVFDFAGGTNMDPAKDGHVHAGRIRLLGDSKIEAEWYFFTDGKLAGTNSFFMARPSK